MRGERRVGRRVEGRKGLNIRERGRGSEREGKEGV